MNERKLSTTKRIKCSKCSRFIRENLMHKHKCVVFSTRELEQFVERYAAK